VRRNGRDERLVTSGGSSDPSFSPGGNRIAFEGNRLASQWDRQQQEYIECYVFGCPDVGIWLVNRDGSGLRNLTEPRAGERGGWFDTGPAFSPNGSRIAFTHVGEIRGEAEIRTMRVDGSRQRVLAGEDSYNPSFSPDGSQLVFERLQLQDHRTDVMVMNADGSEEKLLVRDGAEPAFSPNGKWVVFSRDSREDLSAADLFKVRVNGTGVRQVTFDAENAGESSVHLLSPDWGPKLTTAR
jgi:Tol biopolymer transport system component